MELFNQQPELNRNSFLAFVYALALTLILSSCSLERVEATEVPTLPATEEYETGLGPLEFGTLDLTVERVIEPDIYVAPTQEP